MLVCLQSLSLPFVIYCPDHEQFKHSYVSQPVDERPYQIIVVFLFRVLSVDIPHHMLFLCIYIYKFHSLLLLTNNWSLGWNDHFGSQNVIPLNIRWQALLFVYFIAFPTYVPIEDSSCQPVLSHLQTVVYIYWCMYLLKNYLFYNISLSKVLSIKFLNNVSEIRHTFWKFSIDSNYREINKFKWRRKVTHLHAECFSMVSEKV